MATATLKSPTKARTTRKPMPLLKIVKTENKDACRVTKVCTTCGGKCKVKKKKKPMRKVGSWRGAFKGTLDF